MEGVQVKTEPIDAEAFFAEIDVEENPIKQELFVPEVGIVELPTGILFSDLEEYEDPIKLEPVEDLLDCLSKFPIYQNDVKPAVERKLLDCQVVVPKLLECELCGFYSNNKVELAIHVQAHQAPNTSDWTHSSYKGRIPKNLKCIGCKVKYSDPDMWVWHISNCHGPNPNIKVIQISRDKHNFQCVHCKSTYNRLRTIISHLRDNHNLEKLPFQCNKCNQQYMGWHSLKRHQPKCKKITTVNNIRSIKYNLKCNQCSVKFTQPEFLVWHSDFCHGKNAIVKMMETGENKHNFQCIECGTVCKYLHLMIRHLRAQHQLQKLPFHCKACDRCFILRTELKYHQYLCKKFKNRETIRPKHVNKPCPKSLKCKTCNKTFKSDGNLEKHISIFHNENFNCIHCEHSSFTLFSQLESHCETQHHGKHYLECDICKAEFFTTWGYATHKKFKHEGSVFPCNFCSASFWNPHTLKSHIKSVHSTTQLPCKLCTATFKCKSYLKKHVQRMHSGEILHCAHCEYNTRSKTHIIRHLRRHHF